MRCRGSSGFSLIELLIVLALGATLASFAVPQLRKGLSSYRLSSTAYELAGELNMARTLAASRSTTYEVQLKASSRSYQVTDPSSPDSPPRIKKYLEPGISFARLPSDTVAFFPRGHAHGGSIQIQDKYGKLAVIEVTATGLVQVSVNGEVSLADQQP